MPRRWTIGMLTILLIAISLSWAAEKTPGTSATAPSSGAEASKPSAAPASPEAERGESEQEADTDSSSGPERHGRGDKVAIGEDLDIPEGLSVPGNAVCVGGTLFLALGYHFLPVTF
jgi:hypothetical protein